MPTVDLGDYKKIAKKENKKDAAIEVPDTEVEEAITQLRRFRAQAHLDHEKSKTAKEEGTEFVPTKLEDIDDKDLPELTLEYIQTMGEFESIEDFKAKLKENITAEKTKKASEERRMAIVDGIVDGTTFDIPDLLVNYELDRQLAQLEYDIAMSGLEFDAYLKNIKKTKEELKETMREPAEKRAKVRLVIETIAREEDIIPDPELLEQEVEALMQMYKDNPNTSEDSIRAYISEVLLNQAVFTFLDGVE